MRHTDEILGAPPAISARMSLVHGISAIFIGIGLARFAYSPLIPLLIRDGWYTDWQAQLLGAWGLAGYLAGGFLAQGLARRFPPGGLAGVMGLVVLLSFAFCSFPIHFLHAAVWRTLAGAAGAVLMIAGMSAATERLVAAGRPGWSALIFMGVGGGAVLASVMMLFLPDASAAQTSIGLTIVCGVALLLNLHSGRALGQGPRHHRARPSPRAEPLLHRAVLCVVAAYALDALGMTPHAVYLVDYATREIGFSTHSAAIIWSAFGLGAVLAPLVPLRLLRGGLFWVFVLKGIAIGLVAVLPSPAAFWVSTFCVGFGAPGIGILVSAFIQRTVSPQSYIRYWALATTSFACAQAFGGFSASQLSQHWNSYQPVFALGAACLGLGALAVIGAERLRAGALGPAPGR